MSSLLRFAVLSSSLFLLAMVFALLWYTHSTRLFKYLSSHDLIKSEGTRAKNPSGLSQNILEPRSIVKELAFLFSSELIDDKIVSNHKKYGRIFFILSVLTLILRFF
jgi:hypothetical protein